MSTVEPYDPAWPLHFENLHKRIEAAHEGVNARVEHVGSTAVPGLAAKPIIDIDVVVATPDDVVAATTRLESLGYRHKGNLGIPGREAFDAPDGSGPAHHLYLVVDGSPPYRDHVDVRDWLRTHPTTRPATRNASGKSLICWQSTVRHTLTPRRTSSRTSLARRDATRREPRPRGRCPIEIPRSPSGWGGQRPPIKWRGGGFEPMPCGRLPPKGEREQPARSHPAGRDYARPSCVTAAVFDAAHIAHAKAEQAS